MSTDLTTQTADATTETAAEPRRRKNSSTAVKLIQAAALATLLVPLGSVAMEGASITCGFSGASSSSGCTSTGSGMMYDFNQTESADDDYKIILQFFEMTSSFQMTVTDHTLATFEARQGDNLEGDYDCVALVDPSTGAPCREFEFVSDSGKQWESFHFDFIWDYDSENNGYPNGSGDLGQITILQNKGTPLSGDFTIDMCLEAYQENPDFDTCDYSASQIDPRIGGGNTDFSTATVAIRRSVPEPGTLVLLTAGMGLMASRKRRGVQRA